MITIKIDDAKGEVIPTAEGKLKHLGVVACYQTQMRPRHTEGEWGIGNMAKKSEKNFFSRIKTKNYKRTKPRLLMEDTNLQF